MQSTFLLNLTKVITCATHVDAFYFTIRGTLVRAFTRTDKEKKP